MNSELKRLRLAARDLLRADEQEDMFAFSTARARVAELLKHSEDPCFLCDGAQEVGEDADPCPRCT